MNKKYILLAFAVITIVFIPTVSATKGSRYLDFGDCISVNLKVHDGDKALLDWSTSPYFKTTVGYGYVDISGSGVLWAGYTSGTDCSCNIDCPSGEHTISFFIMNTDIGMYSGTLTYNIRLKSSDAPGINIVVIIGIIVAVIGLMIVIAGIIHHSTKSKRQKEEPEEEFYEIINPEVENKFCIQCGERIEGNVQFCSSCGSKQ